MANHETSPKATVERLVEATNSHQVEAVVACFAPDYRLESPLHPARSFSGQEQVRRNWTQIFAGVPNLAARVLAQAVDGQTIWTEWEMSGTRRDGQPHLMRGVFVFGVFDGLIRTGRMFLELVDESGTNMDAAVQRQLGR
jgi:ketosteroid isomerase-like protein